MGALCPAQMMYLLLPFQAPAFNGAAVVAGRSAAVRAPAAQMAFIDSLCAAACCPEADCFRLAAARPEVLTERACVRAQGGHR